MYSSWSHFPRTHAFWAPNFHRFPLFNETEARSISCWKLSGNALVKYSRSVSRNSESRSFTNGAQLNSFAEKNELAPARTKSSFSDSAAIVFLKLCSYWINWNLFPSCLHYRWAWIKIEKKTAIFVQRLNFGLKKWDHQATGSLGQCIILSSLWNSSESVVIAGWRGEISRSESVRTRPLVLDSPPFRYSSISSSVR